MPDINNTSYKRFTDNKYEDSCPICPLEGDIKVLKETVGDISRKLTLIDTAFLRDDLSATDYPGHRKDHLERRKSDTIINEYKVSGTKVIIGIIVTFILGLLGSGVVGRIAEVIR